ncbi:NUDIX domain-containing protein [Streptomyces sp. NPDC088910]|uniref:NUDIX domain-containing protein n=1 Tax=Streptomyces sp. NPDC088910 TaxID=3365911 RepID=UPI0037FF89DA
MKPSPADPEAWNAYLAEGNAMQARKRVSADVLLRDEEGRVLLVKPTYKPGWDLPGGMAEANEAPDDAARRELKEEFGLDVTLHGLLVVDWVPPHGPWDDQLAFIFDGGTLTARQTVEIRPHDRELLRLRLCPRPKPHQRTRPAGDPRGHRRSAVAVRAGRIRGRRTALGELLRPDQAHRGHRHRARAARGRGCRRAVDRRGAAR